MATKSSTLDFDSKLEAISAGIRHLIKTGHECVDKRTCDFDVALFGEIALRVFNHNTLDEIGRAYSAMKWCKNARKILE